MLHQQFNHLNKGFFLNRFISKASFWRLLIFCFLPLNASSQWTVGTTWHYTFSEEYLPDRFRPLLYKSSKVEVVADTIIDNEIWWWLNVVNGDQCNPLNGRFLASNQNQLIKVMDAQNHPVTWYDFTKNIGDSLQLPIIGFEPAMLTVKIVAIDSILILNKWRTIQVVEIKTPPFFDQAGNFFSEYPVNRHYLIEDIGSTVNFFLFWEGLCHGKRIYNLRCYAENEMTYHHEGFNYCDSTFFWEMNSIDFKVVEMNLYPNPATDRLEIGSDVLVDEIRLFDQKARMICSLAIDAEKGFNLPQNLYNGLYFCALYQAGKRVGQQVLLIRR